MAEVAQHQAQSLPKGPSGPSASTPKKLKKVDPEPVQDTQTEVEDTAGSNIHQTSNGTHEESEYDNITHNDTQEAEEEDDGTEGVVPAGSIDEDGNVIDEDGNIIGHVNGETASAFPGSMVDQEGDILDHEGNVIGKADLDGLKDKAEEVSKKAESVASKPELAAPFGVQDNGEVTNATGAVVGKLTEGTPQDLVGTSIKEIDPEGHMKTETGSTVGKADLQHQVLDKAEGAGSQVGSAVSGSQKVLSKAGSAIGSAVGSVAPDAEDKAEESAPKLDEDGNPLPESKLDEAEVPATEELKSNAETTTEKPELIDEGKSFEQPKLDAEGKPIEEPELDAEGKPVEEPKLDEAEKSVEEPKLDEEGKPIEEPKLDEEGKPTEEPKLDEEGKPIEEPKLDAEGKPIEEPKLDEEGNPIEEPKLDEEGKPVEEPKLDEEGKPIEEPKLDEAGNPLPEEPELPDLSILKGMKVNKLGKIVDEKGNPFGQLSEGDPKKLAGKKVDAEGKIWDDSGKVIGRAELLPETDREAEPSAPFEDFPNSVLDAKGNVIFENKIVGKLIEGDAKKLEGKKVDSDGDVLDKNGNVLGKAERYQEEEVPEEVPESEDLSVLEGKKVNKAGNVVDDQGRLFGKVATGEISKLINKKVGAEGKIYSESGKVIGTAELIPVDEREESSDSPFEDFPNAIVDRHGNILFEGQIVGKLIEGDAKKLVGKKIDKDGEIVDRIGNVLGKAERWIEEDAPEAEKVDLSALAGKRVNKVGNLVDSHGSIYGRLVEGDPKKLAGRMSDKNGQIFDEGGNVVGRAELVPESEREGQKEGPFAGFEGATVTKDGKVQDMKGTIIGRLIEGDGKKLYGKQVDADGDVLDRNGNTLGKAERWEEEEKVKPHSPVAGRKVNREGNVVDENGDVIAKLTEGEITKCSGKEIDEDGDVYNQKNQVIGHVTLLEDIPPPPEEPVKEPEPEPEPQETPEEAEARQQLATDKKLAAQMAYCIQGSLDKITPILKMITDAIETAERQPKEELDEQKLVDTVRPLIEQGGQILQEANGVIRGLDPDGRIAANAKHKTASREATPEEYRLAEVLKELAGNVTQTIENAKKKIAGMPHAKKELNPLWGLLAEPLGQILAAVGLLLAGVLGLVGRLLSGLGLGGLLDNLLGGLGLKGILKGLGLGMVTESLTGRKN